MRRQIALLIVCLLAAGCVAVGDRTQLSVGYYSIRGTSFAEIDQQIALHGPSVTGVGRALAATNVQMIPDFRLQMQGGVCRVASARVAVKAHVTLPRLASQQALRAELARAWDNLEQYARLHEAVHVAIADSYALKAEKEMGALPPEENCDALRDRAILVFRRIMAEHERDQLQFDEDEKERIAAMVARTRFLRTGPET